MRPGRASYSFPLADSKRYRFDVESTVVTLDYWSQRRDRVVCCGTVRWRGVANGTPIVRSLDVRDEDEVFLALAETITDTLDILIPAAAVMPHLMVACSSRRDR